MTLKLDVERAECQFAWFLFERGARWTVPGEYLSTHGKQHWGGTGMGLVHGSYAKKTQDWCDVLMLKSHMRNACHGGCRLESTLTRVGDLNAIHAAPNWRKRSFNSQLRQNKASLP